jgi:hypothetical protein
VLVNGWLWVSDSRVAGAVSRLCARSGGGQDGYRQQYAKDGGGRVGDGVRGVEAGRGRLRC